MDSFIQEVVKQWLDSEQDLKNLTVIIPNNRPKIFFHQAFKDLNYQGILPRFFSQSEFISEVSNHSQPALIDLYFLAYSIYSKIAEPADDFLTFVQWFPTLLADFSDMHSALVPDNRLFDYLKSEERLNEWGENIGNESSLAGKQRFFWEMANEFHSELNKYLKTNKLAYNGLNQQLASERIEEYLNTVKNTIAVVGFNALTKAELKIFKSLKDKPETTFIWDADLYYYEDKAQEAGKFLRQFEKEGFTINPTNHWVEQEKKITVYQSTNSVEMCKAAGKKLLDLNPKNTAIIAADESLTIPLLNAIPDELNAVNVTMGLPLNQSGFMDFVQSLLSNLGVLQEYNSLVTKDLKKLIQNTNINLLGFNLKQVEQKIDNESLYYSREQIKKIDHEFYKLISLVKPMEFLKELNKTIQDQLNENPNLSGLKSIELSKFIDISNRILQSTKKFNQALNFLELKQLIQMLSRSETLDFVGEPLEGIQLMGMLESRLLNFKQLIITSVNEDILPQSAQAANSFLSPRVRSSFGMITQQDRDAIYAYYFYRLLARAEDVHLFYNSASEGTNTGEESRFIKQLKLESGLEIEEKTIEFNQKENKENKKGFTIIKTDFVHKKLIEWSKKGISASALNSYINNPLDFYKQRVLGIRNSIEELPNLNAVTIGTLAHEVIQELYLPYINVPLNIQIINNLQSKVEETLLKHTLNLISETSIFSGRNLVQFELAKTFVNHILEHDKNLSSNNSLVLQSLEQSYSTDWVIGNNKIKLFGIIDRIDTLNGIPRVIDYKTGNTSSSRVSINNKKIDNLTLNKDYKLALQLFVYAKLVLDSVNFSEANFLIYPALFPNFNEKHLEFEGQRLVNKNILNTGFERIGELITEILDKEINLVEKD